LFIGRTKFAGEKCIVHFERVERRSLGIIDVLVELVVVVVAAVIIVENGIQIKIHAAHLRVATLKIVRLWCLHLWLMDRRVPLHAFGNR